MWANGHCLLHNDLASHAGALVGLAVVAVLSRLGELAGHLLARSVQVILVGQRFSVDAALQITQEQVSKQQLGKSLLAKFSTASIRHRFAVGICMLMLRRNCCKGRPWNHSASQRG